MFSKLKPYVSQVSEILVATSVGAIAGELYAILHPQQASIKLLTVASVAVVGGLILGKIFKN